MARVVFGAPLHGKAEHLPEALESLLSQRERDLAVVLVDDASTDATPQVAERYAKLDRRVSYVRNPRRLGLIGAWGRALEEAAARHPEAEYFAWASDHDAWHPRWLTVMTAELDAHPEAVLAYPQCARMGEQGEQLRFEAPWRWDTAGVGDPGERFSRFARDAVAGDMVYGLFRLDAVRRLGFPRALAPDRLLLARLSLEGEFRQVSELLWYRRYVARVSSRRQRAAFFPDRVPVWSRVPWPLAHTATLATALAVRGEARPDVAPAAGLGLALRYGGLSSWRQVRKQLLRPVGAASRLLRRALAACARGAAGA